MATGLFSRHVAEHLFKKIALYLQGLFCFGADCTIQVNTQHISTYMSAAQILSGCYEID